ncbi:MAG TPA: FtsX-like permease family protein [Bacteroides sp.]|nr:FtsX-like permease family protein [Bacteroides sp.]
MFISFLRIALRNALRQKTYTLINVLGLTVGILASILISFWVLDEISYDSYFDNADRIHRIDLYSQTPQTRTPYPMAQALVRDFPEIEMATSFSPIFGPNMSRPTFAVEYEEIRFDEKNIFGADTNFFDVFSFEFIMGDPITAFLAPHAIILTREMSEKYFGKSNSIGKMLTINDEMDFMVTGVLENLPSNLHFHFDFLISYAFLKQVSFSEWFTWADPGHYNYVVTTPEASIQALRAKLPEWIIPFIDYGEEFEQALMDGDIWFQLTPIRDIHLKSHIRWELESNGNLSYVYILLVTSLLVLIVACINYMNLATARFSRRAAEVAVRKTAGTSRSMLIRQFLLESLFQTFIAAILAGLLVELLIDSFSNLTGKDYSFYYSEIGLFIVALLLLAALVGLIAGSYPAFYLSSFSPMSILRGKYTSRASIATVRIVLVIFQFTVSIFLIIGTITIFSQLKFMNNKDLGFDVENIMVIPVKDDMIRSQIEQIKESLLQYPGVENVSAVSNIPGGRFNNNGLSFQENSETVQTSEVSIDYDCIETLGLNIIEGRKFSRELSLDSTSRFIINETAARELGMTSPIGKMVDWYDDDGLYRGEVIGIVEDYHFKSLHENIAPLILMVKPQDYSYLLVRLSPDWNSRTITEIKKEWKKFDDLFTFEYSFLADEFDKQYGNEEKMGTIYWILAILAVIIASLGLFGLSTFTVEQKTHEIGIRKVYGATASGILSQLLIEFSKWVLISVIIACPLAYLGMSYWLRDFSYQTNLSWWIFLAAIIITEGIAVLAVSYQSIRASTLKPVDSLRYE